MSRPQDPPRGFFPFGNPFKMLSPKGPNMSPWLLSLLNSFEGILAERLKKLVSKDKDDILSLSWMKLAMKSLCETHNDIKFLITDLELPVSDWEDKWIDIYLDISVKLLDLCIAFGSEFTRLNRGHLFLKCVLHNLEFNCTEKYIRAQSSLDSWRLHIHAKNPRVENSCTVMNSLIESLNLPKVKKSPKGKVLMQALYGVKVQTVYICSVFAAAVSGSTKDLWDSPVSKKPLWANTFFDMRTAVNAEIRYICSSGGVTVLKELKKVGAVVNKMYPMIQDGISEAKAFKDSESELGKEAEKLSQGLDELSKEIDRFFKIVLTGRDALLSNIRSTDSISNTMVRSNVEEQALR